MKDMTMYEINTLLKSGWTACLNLQSHICPLGDNPHDEDVLTIIQDYNSSMLILCC